MCVHGCCDMPTNPPRILTLLPTAQGLLGELLKDESTLVREFQREERVVEQEIDAAKRFVERIEQSYTLPPWLRWLYKLGIPMPSMPSM